MRIRVRVALPLAAIAAGASLSSPATPHTPPTFPAGVDLVRIDVVVLGDDGQPVTGLTVADFEVTEGGRTHDIVSFEPIVVRSPSPPATSHASVSEQVVPVPEENRSFLIFLDDVHLGPESAERVRAQLIPFLERETRDGDWVTVLAPLSRLRWTARTAVEHRQLSGVISNLKGLLVRNPFRDPMTEFEAMRRVEGGALPGLPAHPLDQYAGRLPEPPRNRSSTYGGNIEQIAQEKYLLAKRRVRQSLGALGEAIQALAGFRGRKALLFYSEGFIKSPGMSDYDRVIELARRAHVAVYFVDPRGLRTGFATDVEEDGPSVLVQLDTRAGGTSYVAAATGGRASISNDVTALVREAALESSSYYLIGFQPTVGKPGERKIKIRVQRDDVSVRATDRYLVGEPDSRGKPAPAVVQALTAISDATDVPLRVATLFLDGAPRGEQKATLAVELDRNGADGPERRLNLVVDARPADGGKPVRDTTELSVPSRGVGPVVATRDLLLRPGVWQARVVVRDVGTDKVGSVLHTFEVRAGTGLRLSSPLLTDELESERSPRPRLRLTRRYMSGAAFYCQYRVFGAAVDPTSGKPRVRASWAILRGGAVVREEAATLIEPTKDGQLMRLLGFGLAGFEPGDYAIVLRVSDDVADQQCERTEPFAVAASGPS
jgi:VWFA-related protein